MPVNGTTYPSTRQPCLVTLGFDPRNTSSFPVSAIPTWITVSVISGVIAIPIFVINLLVIWTVLERESVRSVIYNQLIAILSLTDLLTGLVACPVFITFNSCLLLGCSSICNITIAYAVVAIVLAGWTMAAVMIISVERYLFIEHPLYYIEKVNTKKVMTATAVAWLFVASLLMYARFTVSTSSSNAIKLIPAPVILGGSVIITIYCLTKMSRTAYRQTRAIQATQASVQGANAKKIKEFKQIFTLGLVVLASVLFYCPLFIVKIIAVVKGNEWSSNLSYISHHIFMTFMQLQSLVNPVIFSLRLSYIRTGVLKKLLRRPRNDRVDLSNTVNNEKLRV